MWDISDGVHDGSQKRKQAVTKLHHSTILRLAEAGPVKHTPNSDLVRYQGHPELETILDALEGVDRDGVTDSD